MDSTIAIIDLGTNTFHLLLAVKHEGHFKITHRERAAVKLGLGGINQGIILPEALQRAIDTLLDFKTTIRNHQVGKIYAFGTSALRNARNAEYVIEQLRQLTGIKVSVLSGEEEAQLIYEGVRSAMDLGMDPSLIVDIGGGSVEFIIGNKKNIFWKTSVEIGAQRLLEKFKPQDPINTQDIEKLNNYFDESLRELHKMLSIHKPLTLAGSSGTFDSLSDIYCAKTGIAKSEFDGETPLTIESFHTIYKDILSKNRAERLLIPGMIELRVDMIVVTCCMVHYLLERHSFNDIRVSSYSLREGILATL